MLVAGLDRPNVVELWDWTLQPGDRHTSQAHPVGTRELLHVQEGAVEVRIAEETVVLLPGDAASFRGDLAHGYANTSERAARFSLAVFEPAGAARPRTDPGHG